MKHLTGLDATINDMVLLLCQLGTQIKDPVARLAAIKESIAKGKACTGAAHLQSPRAPVQLRQSQ